MKLKKHIYLHTICLYSFYISILLLSIISYIEYRGNGYVYIFFTIVSSALLYSGFRKNAIFFDTFVGVFFWLGFWLKFSCRIAFAHGHFYYEVGAFDGTGQSFDQALLVTTCGFFGLLVASYARERFIFTYPEKLRKVELKGLFQLYKNHRKLVLSLFATLFITISFTNMYFNIYQRGTIPNLILPYGMSGVYKWFLQFGGASFSALILHFEFTLNKKTSYLVVVISLLESFLNNISLLSRGMILNVSALVYGVIRSVKVYSLKSNYRFLITSFFIFLILFVTSVFLVNQLRYNFSGFSKAKLSDLSEPKLSDLSEPKLSDLSEPKLSGLSKHLSAIATLPLDRWIGIEGVMSVSAYPGKGWDLWNNAWKEEFKYHENTFYDNNLIASDYNNNKLSDTHFVQMAGMLAFCFYPGSYSFLFICMFFLGLVAAFIEICVYRLGGKNLILCALLAQVVAYRYAHFGYVPKQSYLIFGALYLNLFLIYFSNLLTELVLKEKSVMKNIFKKKKSKIIKL